LFQRIHSPVHRASVFILLTDVLTCPRCGPGMGLVVMAEHLEERRVREGRLGCPNCRAHYPVRGGVADLRLSGAGDLPPTVEATQDTGEAAVRIAALLGLADATGLVLAAGHPPALAGAVSALVREVEVVSLTAAPAGAAPEGVSPVLAAGAMPFRAGAFRGVALHGGADAARLAEALRVVAPGSRVVVENAPAGTADALAAAGAEVLLDQEEVVVARAPGHAARPVQNAIR
jgi:uncharacterized protein YbaR (Trm112 family)